MNKSILDPDTITLELADEPATIALAATLAGHVRTGDIIALSGELGAGKTTFARGFIQARREGPEEVPSPTFTLVQIYENAHNQNGPNENDHDAIYHFDLYRLTTPEEAYELGIEEAFVSGISLIEWPEQLGFLMPPERLEIKLDFTSESQARRAVLTGYKGWAARLKETGLG